MNSQIDYRNRNWEFPLIGILALVLICCMIGTASADWFNSATYGFANEIENFTENYAYVANGTGKLCGTSYHFKPGGGQNWWAHTVTGCDGDNTFVNKSCESSYFNATNCTGNDIKDVYNASGVWCFDLNSGQNVADCSGYANNGTCYDGSSTTTCNWTTGRFGTGIDISGIAGTTNWVELGKPESLDVSGDVLTIEAWLYRACNTDGANDCRFSVIGSTDGNSDGYWFGGQVRASYKALYFWVEGTTAQLEITNFTLAHNQWNHVVLVHDVDEARVYLNGTLWATKASTGNATVASGGYRIGKISAYPHADYWGTVEEVRVYNRSLTGAEIYQHYLNGINGSIAGVKPEETAPSIEKVVKDAVVTILRTIREGFGG